MSEERSVPGQEMSGDGTARREFLRKSGGAALAAPAVALLLAAQSKGALALVYDTQPPPGPPA